MSNGEKLGVGLGVTIAVLAVGLVGLMIWWVRKKRKFEAEVHLSLYPHAPKEGIYLVLGTSIFKIVNTR